MVAELVSCRDPRDPPVGAQKLKLLPDRPPGRDRMTLTLPQVSVQRLLGPGPASPSGPPPKRMVLILCPGLTTSASNPLSQQEPRPRRQAGSGIGRDPSSAPREASWCLGAGGWSSEKQMVL